MDAEQEQQFIEAEAEQSVFEQIGDSLTSSNEAEDLAGNIVASSAEDVAGADAATAAQNLSMMEQLFNEIFYSPMNLCLLLIIIFLVYKIVRDRTEVPGANETESPEAALPKLRRDFTVKELRAYDGTQPDGRVLVAVNGTIYDVTKGKRFYGPGGPYASFAGRDASRNLGTFSVEQNNKDEYDDLSDLTAMEMDSVIEWEMQFKEKYDFVGKLLRENEVPNVYDDEEEDDQDQQRQDAIPPVGGLRKRTPGVQKVDAATKTINNADQKIELVKADLDIKNSSENSEADDEPKSSTDC